MYNRIISKIFQASGAGNVGVSARSGMQVDQGVCAVRALELPVLVCLRSSCNHVTGGKTVRIVRLTLKIVKQNDGEFVDVILLLTLRHEAVS
jgi:hypothetical protein